MKHVETIYIYIICIATSTLKNIEARKRHIPTSLVLSIAKVCIELWESDLLRQRFVASVQTVMQLFLQDVSVLSLVRFKKVSIVIHTLVLPVL